MKPGYKQTEVGVIPEEWKIVPMGEIAQCLGGLTYSPDDVRDFGTLVLRSSNVQDGKLAFDDNVFVQMDIPDRAITREGDILICVRNGSRQLIGKCAQIDKPTAGSAFGAFMAVLRSDSNSFLFHQFQSTVLKKQISDGLGATINQITNRDMANYKVIYPPKKVERDAIAEALSDADTLIDSLAQLLAKKRDLKQGAMQELLTGKTRLPGFTSLWKSKQVDDLGIFLKGSGVTKDQTRSGELPCVRYGEIYTKHNEYIREFNSWISREVASDACRLKYGDILFAGSGETKSDIGKCVAFVDRAEAYAGGDIVILRTEMADPIFLGYYLNTSDINRQKASSGQGDAVVHISAASISRIEGKFPEMEEQSAIAAVLVDIDRDITELEAKLTKARQLKQGMMQELLTGRIRLNPKSSNVVSLPVKQVDTKSNSGEHNTQINEAVVLSILTHRFGSEQYPLGRFRRTKLTYLLHRHVEHEAQGFLKKAAGPYNPTIKYGGAEKIAIKNGYVRQHKSGQFEGFVAADNIDQAHAYFDKWYGTDVLKWLDNFKFKKKDELELLTTVDIAMHDLVKQGQEVNLESVKMVIKAHPEWTAKLDRAVFSDDNITRAMAECRTLFDH